MGEKSWAIRDNRFLDPLEYSAVDTFRVITRLQEEWLNRRNEYRLAHAFCSVGTHIAGHLAAPHRKTYQGEFTKVELGHELVQVLGKRVVVVAFGRLA